MLIVYSYIDNFVNSGLILRLDIYGHTFIIDRGGNMGTCMVIQRVFIDFKAFLGTGGVLTANRTKCINALLNFRHILGKG